MVVMIVLVSCCSCPWCRIWRPLLHNVCRLVGEFIQPGALAEPLDRVALLHLGAGVQEWRITELSERDEPKFDVVFGAVAGL